VIQQAKKRICETQGNIRIEDLSYELGISRQYLSRTFTAEVGLSPKVYSRVMKLKATNNILISNNSSISYANLAMEQGYFDQAHLIAEYQSLVGLTPYEYKKSYGINDCMIM
jgi:AraC-like DNA-binding protein